MWALVASHGQSFMNPGCLPQLETLALFDGWLPNLLLVAPEMKLLSIRVYQHTITNLRLLRHHPVLQTINMSVETLQSPLHLPLFLPEGCIIANLTTLFRLGDVASGLLPAALLLRIVNLTASTREPTKACQKDLAPLSACSLLRTLIIFVLGHKLMLCVLHHLPLTLNKILIRWDPARPPTKVFHQLTPGWGCKTAAPGTQDMLCLYRLPKLP